MFQEWEEGFFLQMAHLPVRQTGMRKVDEREFKTGGLLLEEVNFKETPGKPPSSLKGDMG